MRSIMRDSMQASTQHLLPAYVAIAKTAASLLHNSTMQASQDEDPRTWNGRVLRFKQKSRLFHTPLLGRRKQLDTTILSALTWFMQKRGIFMPASFVIYRLLGLSIADNIRNFFDALSGRKGGA